MHRPIQLAKTTSFPGASQITWPDDNKATGRTRFRAPIANLGMAVSLLNGFLKAHRKVEEQESTVNELKLGVAKQQEQITALACQIQKVSDRLELSEGAPRIVASDP